MTTNASPNMIVVLLPRLAVTPAGPKDMRLVRSHAARFGLARLFVIAARSARMLAPDPRQPFNRASRLLSIAEKPAPRNRLCAFPIAANRSAPSFNPAYVRSPFRDARPRAPATSHNPPDSQIR